MNDLPVDILYDILWPVVADGIDSIMRRVANSVFGVRINEEDLSERGCEADEKVSVLMSSRESHD